MRGVTTASRYSAKRLGSRLVYGITFTTLILSLSSPSWSLPRPHGINTNGRSQITINLPRNIKNQQQLRDISIVLRPGERIRHATVLENRILAITNYSVLIITRNSQESDGIVSLRSKCSRFDARDLLRRGIVATTHAPEGAYVLTEDGMITPTFIDEGEGSQDRHFIAGDVSRADIVYVRGFLLVAPVDGYLIAIPTEEDRSPTGIRLPESLIGLEHSSFFTKNGELFFGDQEKKRREIKIGKDVRIL